MDKYATDTNITNNNTTTTTMNSNIKVYSPSELYILEQRISFIITLLEEQHVINGVSDGMDGQTAEPEPKKPKKEKKHKASKSQPRATDTPPQTNQSALPTDNTRMLLDDYSIVPYEALPHYNSMVQRPLSMEIIKSKLNTHLYRSFESFAVDFHTMLNNGRSISAPNSMVREA